jgi:AcrR family transcriptional regulator
MKSGQAGHNPEELCDTVAHTPAAPVASSLTDPRAVKSGHALRAALLALLERKPLEQITVREITAQAGVHYATFFRHHPTKEALLDDVAADQIDQLVALSLPVLDAVDGYASFLTLCRYVDEHRKLWTALLTGGAAGAMKTELLRVSKEVANERGPKEGWMPVELAVICTVSLIVEILSWWLAQPAETLSPAEAARILHRMVSSSSINGSLEEKPA